VDDVLKTVEVEVLVDEARALAVELAGAARARPPRDGETDIVLLGPPNAGKSTLLNATSRATAKVGAYPFTTRKPQLGIAELPGDRRVILADIPGLIEGASEGAGLGTQFLRHLQRTRLLLHVVDIAPLDPNVEPAVEVRAIEKELAGYSEELASKPRWLVINKTDLLDEEGLDEARQALLEALGWEGPVFEVSAATGAGTDALGHAVMQALERMNEEDAAEA